MVESVEFVSSVSSFGDREGLMEIDNAIVGLIEVTMVVSVVFSYGVGSAVGMALISLSVELFEVCDGASDPVIGLGMSVSSRFPETKRDTFQKSTNKLTIKRVCGKSFIVFWESALIR